MEVMNVVIKVRIARKLLIIFLGSFVFDFIVNSFLFFNINLGAKKDAQLD